MIEPTDADILLGRGVRINTHPGNETYREIIRENAEIYARSSKLEKTAMSTKIVTQLLHANPPRRFLEKTHDADDDNDNMGGEGQWNEVPLKRAVTKTSQALRDAARERRSIEAESKSNSNGLSNICGGGAGTTTTRTTLEATTFSSPLSLLQQPFSNSNIILPKIPSSSSSIINPAVAAAVADLTPSYPPAPNLNLVELLPLLQRSNAFMANQQQQVDFGLIGFGGEMDSDPSAAGAGVFMGDFSSLMDTVVRPPEIALAEACGVVAAAAGGGVAATTTTTTVGIQSELNLVEWIRQEFPSSSQAQVGGESVMMSKYLASALGIAIKLTEFLSENEVPLESISVENTLVCTSYPPQEDDVNVILKIQSSSSSSGRKQGSKNDRLFAVGQILFPLLSGSVDEIEVNYFSPQIKTSSLVIDSINLNPVQLERLDLPQPVKAILCNLLECGLEEEFVGKEAYTSFDDLLIDLKLLKLEGLSRFHQSPHIEISENICGRDKEIDALNASYRNRSGSQGVLIMGAGGVGKSRIAAHILEITRKGGGHAFATKFDLNRDVSRPLSKFGEIFTDLIDLFASAASPSEFLNISHDLDNALGNRAALLYEVLPSLVRIMPSCTQVQVCIDDRTNIANGIKFMLCKLLEILISYVNGRVTVLFDDVQWADAASLSVISSLLKSNEGPKHVYYVFCSRDNVVQDDLVAWLDSMSVFSLDHMKLESLTQDGVNQFVSETLRLFPRLTRPLSLVLHRKTGGNPLFLGQFLLSSMGGRDASPYSPQMRGDELYFSLSQSRWTWDIDKMEDVELADVVVTFIVNEMKKVSADLMLGLRVAACIGSRMNSTVIGILSSELHVSLCDIFLQLTERGFLSKHATVSGTQFEFAHDKILEAAYSCMSSRERRVNHMRFGLSLYPRVIDKSNDELLFLAINQINMAGSDSIFDADKKHVVASLNLIAGKRASQLSDFQTALSLFRHGILFLGADCWDKHYDTTLELYNSAAEAAVIVNDLDAVNLYFDAVNLRAKCVDDKLDCICAKVKGLIRGGRFTEAIEAFLVMLNEAGEPTLRPFSSIQDDMKAMNSVMTGLEDETLLSLSTIKRKKTITLMSIYCEFGQMILFVDPIIAPTVTLRMMQITIEEGLCSKSALVFSRYAQTLFASNHIGLSVRFGRLAMKLLERIDAFECAPSVYAALYYVLWLTEPFQAMTETFRLGKQIGELTGDVFNTLANNALICLMGYIAGAPLGDVRKQSVECIGRMKGQNMLAFLVLEALLHSQIAVLMEGSHIADAESLDDVIYGEKEALSKIQDNVDAVSCNEIFQMIRAFLFRKLSCKTARFHTMKIFDPNVPEEPLQMIGIFFVGLSWFYFAREAKEVEEKEYWMESGGDVIEKMGCWSSHSAWNFQNKLLLLKAEKAYCRGETDAASTLYEESIKSAQEHKFIHEEAIAHELCGHFYLETGRYPDALRSFNSSIECYMSWEALAVARRVEDFVRSNFFGVEEA